MQSRANFYHYFLYDGVRAGVALRDVVFDGPESLESASADYRLGALNTYTAGAKVSKVTKYGTFNLRADFMRQEDREQLFASVNATIFQFIWRLKFF
jgi:hypothetical protein